MALAASNISQTGFTANWNTSSTTIGYRLDIATDNTFTNFVTGYSNKDVGNVTTLSVTGLTAGTTYYYRVKAYNTSATSDVSNTINVSTLSNVSGFNLSGQLLYENTAQTPLNDVSVTLLNSNSQPVGYSTTDATGSFSFPGLSNGNYALKPDVNFIWGGATAMDITLYKKHIGNVSTLPQLQVKSGDVNGSNSLTSMDLTIIKQRIGAQISSFTTGDWVYDPITTNINETNLVQNIKAMCYGDANGSYMPSTLKSSSNVFFAVMRKIGYSIMAILVPLILNQWVPKLASITLVIDYPYELFDVNDIKMIAHNEDLYYSVKGGIITVIYSTLNSLRI